MDNPGDFVIFGPKANCTLELCPIEMSVYGYRPNLAVNIMFVALFSLATFVHIYLGLRWKTPGFMWCLILSCTHEIGGYVCRIMLWRNPWSFGAFITQIILITQAPVFYCAAIYVTLGQSMKHYDPSLARVSPRIMACVFVTFDIISLILQGTGGGLSATSSGASEIGVDVAMAGLILQVIMLVSFSILLADYMIRYFRSKGSKNIGARDKTFFAFLAPAVLSTLARCIFRADELKEGYQGELIKHEDLFIGLEGVLSLIVVAVYALCIAHPGFAFRSKSEVQYSGINPGISNHENMQMYKPYASGHAADS